MTTASLVSITDVEFIPLADIVNYTDGFDVMISSRTVAPFAPSAIKERFKTFTVMPDFEASSISKSLQGAMDARYIL